MNQNQFIAVDESNNWSSTVVDPTNLRYTKAVLADMPWEVRETPEIKEVVQVLAFFR